MLVSKAAMEADSTVAIYSLPRLLALLRGSYDEARAYSLNDLVDRLCSVDLLHVDDVGSEQSSPWVLEQLYTIVNTRYEDGRAMLLTTNLDKEQLQAQIGERTVSRLFEMCGTPLPVCGHDRREEAEFRLPEPAAATTGGAGPRARRWANEDDAWADADPDLEDRQTYGRPRGPKPPAHHLD
jgi:DNA replication protein DnaC